MACRWLVFWLAEQVDSAIFLASAGPRPILAEENRGKAPSVDGEGMVDSWKKKWKEFQFVSHLLVFCNRIDCLCTYGPHFPCVVISVRCSCSLYLPVCHRVICLQKLYNPLHEQEGHVLLPPPQADYLTLVIDLKGALKILLEVHHCLTPR